MRHLLNPLDFSVDEIDQLLDLASDIEQNPEKYAHVCDGKKLATLFYEPSTRTRLSFESAMLNPGGSVLGFQSADRCQLGGDRGFEGADGRLLLGIFGCKFDDLFF